MIFPENLVEGSPGTPDRMNLCSLSAQGLGSEIAFPITLICLAIQKVFF